MKAWSHERKNDGKDEWLTPPEIVTSLGEFDLDPCSPIVRPWDTAKNYYTILNNGLLNPWHGRVWLNPPYGTGTSKWLARMVEHGNGIALIFARVETRMFFDYVWDQADAILFIKGRLSFYHVDGTKGGTAGAPSCLIAYGSSNVDALSQSKIAGKLILL